jgi:hypothetical protein
MTVRNNRENKLDAKLRRSKHVKATNNVKDVDRLNEPHIKTRKTNELNIIPIITIDDVNIAKCVEDKYRNTS